MKTKNIVIIGIIASVLLILKNRTANADTTVLPPDPKVPAGPLGLGDVDMDGWVSILDYDLIQDIRFGQGEFTEEQLRRADINQDGVVSLQDYSSCALIMNGRQEAR